MVIFVFKKGHVDTGAVAAAHLVRGAFAFGCDRTLSVPQHDVPGWFVANKINAQTVGNPAFQ